MQVVIRLRKFAFGYLLIIFAVVACVDLVSAHGSIGSVIGIAKARALVYGHGRDRLRLAQIDVQGERMSADGVLVRIAVQIIVK